MKSIKNLRWLIVVTFISTALGIVFDWKGFVIGIFSGLVGAVLGVWVSVAIIEDLTERQRAKDWYQVRDAVLKYLAVLLTEIATEYLTFVSVLEPYVDILRDIDAISTNKLQSVNTLYTTLLNADLSTIDKKQILDVQHAIYSRITLIHGIQIRELVLPGNVPSLIEALQELEYAAIRWHEAVLLDGKISITKDVLFQRGIDTLGALLKPMKHFLDSNH